MEPKDIFGEAIKAYYQTGKEQLIKVHSDNFEDDEILVSYLFRSFEEMPEIEQKALQLCRGDILDVGCGAGSHSLYLQNKGCKVKAIDTAVGAIEICGKRGVLNAQLEDFYRHKESYDTILLLMNGSGIIGELKNFSAFFSHLKTILNPNGQVFIDSSDLIYLFENENGEFWVDASKGYYGEMKYQVSFNRDTSEVFNWLYVDYNTLQRAAHFSGFNCELIIEGEHYDYLARLSIFS